MVVKAERVLLLYSDGSEGLSSINSDGSEELYFIYNIIDSLFFLLFCERQFKTNVQGFIFMNLYWPIGNCRYQLAFLFSLFIWQTSHFAHFSSIFQIYKW